MKTFFLLFIVISVQSWKITSADSDRDLFLSLAPFNNDAILSRSKRQSEESTSDRATSTDLCEENEYLEFISDLGVCYDNTITQFLDEYDFEASDLENERATCNKFKNQAKCFTQGGPRKLKCYTSQQNKNRKLNFLYKKHQQITVNGTSQDGQRFINSCAAFANFERDYIKFQTDSNLCSFEEFERKFKEWDNCLDETLSKAEQRRNLAISIGGAAGL